MCEEPLFPLLKAEPFSGIAVDIDMGICLSACANNDLASSLSFFSLAITRQAASCCQHIEKPHSIHTGRQFIDNNDKNKQINLNIIPGKEHD